MGATSDVAGFDWVEVRAEVAVPVKMFETPPPAPTTSPDSTAAGSNTGISGATRTGVRPCGWNSIK